jgi:hypothetical protein
MNKLKITAMCAALVAMTLGSCKKEDDDNELKLEFKTGSGYTSADQTLAKGTAFKIGVTASTEKKKDPLKKFNITETINGGSGTTVFEENLEKQDYDHDQNFTVTDTVHGNKHQYTFVIVNKDGINKQKAITITVQ